MKKIYSIILVAASLAVAACQPTELDNITPIDKSGNSIKITATIDGIDSETKVSYAPEGKGLKPSWTKSEDPYYADKILVFTLSNNSVSQKAIFAVSEISKTGVATFSYESGDVITGLTTETKVYGIYYPGKTLNDISDNGSITVDISAQNGVLGDNTPAIMCATATVGSDGSVNFTFENQTAIVGINKLQVGSGSEGSLGTSQSLTSVQLSGVKTIGTIKIVNDQLTLVGGDETATITAKPDQTVSWNTSTTGIIEFSTTPLAFAVIPSLQKEEPYVTAVFKKDETDYTFTNSKAIDKVSFAAGCYYYMSKKLDCEGEAVAKVNDKRYATIDAAFAAANISDVDETTITLLKDCTASNQLVLNDDTKTSSIIFDLNGHKLTGPNDNYTIKVQYGRYLEINDSESNGKIFSSAAYAVIYVQNSSLTISGGTIQSTDSSIYGFGILSSGNSEINITGGKVISGTYSEQSDSYTGGHIGIYVGSGSTLNVEGGNIIGYERCIRNLGITSIKDGTFLATSKAESGTSVVITEGASATASITDDGYFSSNSQTVELFTVLSNGTCNVTGGFFDRPVNVNRTGNDYRNILNTNSTTSGDYPFIVSDGSVYYINKSNNLYYNHNNIAAAAKHAQLASYDVVIQLNQNSSPKNTTVDLTNNKEKSITLDLNGKTLTTTAESFITTSGKLTITDNSTDKGGTITSNQIDVICIGGKSPVVNISNCKIKTTSGTTSLNYFEQGVVYQYCDSEYDADNSSLTISKATIYATKGVTGVCNRRGNLTIDDGENEGDVTEISSGTGYSTTSTNALVAVFAGTGKTVIKSGCFYTSNTSGTRPAVYVAGDGGTVGDYGTLEVYGGYFYANGRSVRCATSSKNESNITLYGGYYNKDLSYVYQEKTYSPKIADNHKKVTLDTPVEFPHSQKTTSLTFGYQVALDNIGGGTDEPAASLGNAVTGGITIRKNI